jgi:hypothetical protein
MASKADSISSREQSTRLGRSAVTGQFVLRPATTKGATLTRDKVSEVVRPKKR